MDEKQSEGEHRGLVRLFVAGREWIDDVTVYPVTAFEVED